MRRVFLTNLALVLVLNLLVKPFYILGVDAGVQDAVGSAAYGTYAALLSLTFLLNIVLDLGITNYNTRHIAQHTQLMGKYIGGVASLRVALMLVYAVLTLGTGVVLGYRGEPLAMLGWLVLNQALVATILYLRSNIAGAQRFRQDSLLSVLDRVLLIGGVGWLLWGRSGGAPFQIEWFVMAQTAAYAVTLLVALAMALRLSGPVRLTWRPAFSFMVVRQSLPYALLILLMSFYYRADMLMLERLLPDGNVQAGIYAQGFRFFEAFNMLGYLLAGLLLPMFSRMLRERQQVMPLAMLAFRLVLAGALAVAVFAAWRAQGVMDLRYTHHTDQSAPAFAVLMWSFVAVCTTYVFGTLLTARGELRLLNIMAALGALVNIGLNLYVIPRWQVEGAAWVGLLVQGGTAIAQLILVLAAFGTRFPWSVLLRATGHTAGLVALMIGMERLGWPITLELLVYAPAAIALAFGTGLVRRDDLSEGGSWLR